MNFRFLVQEENPNLKRLNVPSLSSLVHFLFECRNKEWRSACYREAPFPGGIIHAFTWGNPYHLGMITLMLTNE